MDEQRQSGRRVLTITEPVFLSFFLTLFSLLYMWQLMIVVVDSGKIVSSGRMADYSCQRRFWKVMVMRVLQQRHSSFSTLVLN